MASRKGSPNKHSQAVKIATKDFIKAVLDDERESKLWDRFLNSEDEHIMWEAFKRAVEYKRGKPIQPVSGENGGAIAVRFVTNVQLPSVQ